MQINVVNSATRIESLYGTLIDDVDYSSYFSANFQVTLDSDSAFSSASLEVVLPLTLSQERHVVEIYCGWNGTTDLAFRGEIISKGSGYWPPRSQLQCGGFLKRTEVGLDVALGFYYSGGTTAQQNALIAELPPIYLPTPILTDADIIIKILEMYGITPTTSGHSIAASARAVARLLPILWEPGASGWGIISELDRISPNMRTSEGRTGAVYRRQTFGMVPSGVRHTFIQGADILDVQASETYEVHNQVVVKGAYYDVVIGGDSEQVMATVPPTNPTPSSLIPDPPGVRIDSSLNSPYIETEVEAGLIGGELLGRVQQPLQNISLTTFGSPDIDIGDGIGLSSNRYTGNTFVSAHSLSGSPFRSVFRLRGSTLADRRTNQPPVANFIATVVSEQALSGGGIGSKLPSIALDQVGSVAFWAWTQPNAVNVASAAFTSVSGTAVKVGDNGSQAGYFNSAIATSATKVHLAYVKDGTSIRYRSRTLASSVWSTDVEIAIESNFGNAVTISALGTTVAVIWRDTNGGLHWARSTNDGASWTTGIISGANAYAGLPKQAQGSTDFVVWAGASNGNIYLGTWNGSAYTTAAIATHQPDLFQPSVDVASDGALSVAYRSVALGVYLSTKPSGGAWSFQQIFATTSSTGPVIVRVNGTLRVVAYITSAGVFYVTSSAGAAWSAPASVSADTASFRTNLDIGQNDAGGLFFAWESWNGEESVVYYRTTALVGSSRGGGAATIAMLTIDMTSSSDMDGTIASWTLTVGETVYTGVGPPSIVSHVTVETSPVTATLVVTDSGGLSHTYTQNITWGETSILVEPLVIAENTQGEATLNELVWKSTTHDVTAVAPIALSGTTLYGCSNGQLYRSLDLLVTAPTLITTFGSKVNCLWNNEKIPARWYAGLESGEVWLSIDDGLTWVLRGVSFGVPINDIAESPFAAGQVTVAAGFRLWFSYDAGGVWSSLITHTVTCLRFASGSYGGAAVTYAGFADGSIRRVRNQLPAGGELVGTVPGGFPIMGLTLDRKVERAYVFTDQSASAAYSMSSTGVFTTGPVMPTATKHAIRSGVGQWVYAATDGAVVKARFDPPFLFDVRVMSSPAQAMKVGYGGKGRISVAAVPGEFVTPIMVPGGNRYGVYHRTLAGGFVVKNNGLPATNDYKVSYMAVNPVDPNKWILLLEAIASGDRGFAFSGSTMIVKARTYSPIWYTGDNGATFTPITITRWNASLYPASLWVDGEMDVVEWSADGTRWCASGFIKRPNDAGNSLQWGAALAIYGGAGTFTAGTDYFWGGNVDSFGASARLLPGTSGSLFVGVLYHGYASGGWRLVTLSGSTWSVRPIIGAGYYFGDVVSKLSIVGSNSVFMPLLFTLNTQQTEREPGRIFRANDYTVDNWSATAAIWGRSMAMTHAGLFVGGRYDEGRSGVLFALGTGEPNWSLSVASILVNDPVVNGILTYGIRSDPQTRTVVAVQSRRATASGERDTLFWDGKAWAKILAPSHSSNVDPNDYTINPSASHLYQQDDGIAIPIVRG